MNDEIPPSITPSPVEPDVRLELSSDGVRRTWSIYSDEQAPQPESGQSLTFNLEDFWKLVQNGRRAMLAWVVVCLVLGLVYIQMATPIYNVVAQVLVVSRAMLTEQSQPAAGGSAQFLSTQAEVITSAAVLESVVPALSFVPGQALEVNPVAALVGRVKGSVKRFIRGLNLPFMPQEPAVERTISPVLILDVSLTASPIQGTNVLSLSFVGTSPDHGVEVLGLVISAYRDFIKQIEATEHEQDFQVLIERERELRDQLEALSADYNKAHAESEIIGDSGAVSVQRELLDRLAEQLVGARTNRIALENQLHALEEFGDSGSSRESSESREQLREALWRAEVRMAELGSKYNDEHPRFVDVRQQVVALREQLAKAESLERKSLHRELRAAQSTEQRLADVYNEEIGKAKKIDSVRMRQAQTAAEVDRLAAAHQAALAMLRDAQLTQRGLDEGRAKIVVHVLQEPRFPEEPMWPRPALILGPCIVLGVILGLVTAFFFRPPMRLPEPIALSQAPRPEPGVDYPQLPAGVHLSRRDKSAR